MKKIIDSNKCTMQPEKLPFPWFGVSHGIDNYHDCVNLEEVAFFVSSWKYLPGNMGEDDKPIENDEQILPIWDVILRIYLKSGRKVEMHLTPLGYENFLRGLKRVEVVKVPKSSR